MIHAKNYPDRFESLPEPKDYFLRMEMQNNGGSNKNNNKKVKSLRWSDFQTGEQKEDDSGSDLPSQEERKPSLNISKEMLQQYRRATLMSSFQIKLEQGYKNKERAI